MKTRTKSAFHRGFTLIELMIVIVILGILMATILPRLSGAQARARDTGRLADLTAISQALELYFDDFGSYPEPNTVGTPVCLTPGSSFSFESVFETYFKANAIPAPNATEVIDVNDDDTAECTGGYMYIPLLSGNRNPGAYALVANVETASKGNVLFDDGAPFGAANDVNYDSDTLTLDDVLNGMETPADMVAGEAADTQGNGTVSVYVLTGQE
jgi:prepilin-type N-terminal cleavage/methylation domain-containing protein